MNRCFAILAALLILTACGDDTASDPTAGANPSASPSSSMSESELLEQFAAAMERDGEVFHTTITATSTAGEAYPEQAGTSGGLWTEEIWVAADDDAARRVFRKDPDNSADLADEAEVLLVDGTLYFEDDDEIEDEEWRPFCPPGDPEQLVAFVLEVTCESFGPGTDMGDDTRPVVSRIDPDTSYGGQPATAIVYEQVIQPEGQPSPTPFSPAPPTPQPNVNPQRMEARLYFDSETSLPLAWETRLWDHDDRLMVTLLAEFENEFITLDNLEAGYFDPDAFGYVYVDPLSPLDDPDLDVTVYWLGERFEPGGDLPPVEIYDVLGLRPPGGGPGDQVMIEYEVVEADPNAFGFRLQLWTPEDWENQGSQIGSELWQNPCVAVEEVDVDGGTATIYQTYEPLSPNRMFEGSDSCPDREHDRFMTIINYGDTIMTVNAPLTIHPNPRGNENAVDPYDSLKGMRAIIDGLQPLDHASVNAPSTPTETAVNEIPALEVIYAGLAATLEREDKILHMTRSVTGEATGFVEMDVTFQQWVDARAPVARIEFEGEYVYVEQNERLRGVSHIIIRDGSEYSRSEGDVGQTEPRAVEAEGCYGQPEAIAIVIGCPGPTETSTTTIEWAEYEGQQALLLVTEGETRGSDEVTTFLRHTYLDPDTFLPIFAEEDGAFNTGSSFPQAIVTRYEHEFVERSSLPDDFFELSAIGYSEPEPAAQIDEYFDTPVYWLGEHFEPDGALPPLVLSVVSGNYDIPPELPHYDGTIHYALADNPHGPGVIGMQLWPASGWGEGGSASMLDGIAVRPCNASETFPIEGGDATIYHWVESGEITENEERVPTPELDGSRPSDDPAECDTPGTTRYMAIVEFTETVIVIDAPGSSSPRDGYQPSLYNSAEGMRTVIGGLVLR